MANKLIKPIKKALAAKYGYKNVNVKNGRGTAWGWVEAKIKVKKPEQCHCGENNLIGYCDYCKSDNERHKIRAEAEIIATQAIQKENLSFYTYCSDDGYNTERNNFLLRVEYI